MYFFYNVVGPLETNYHISNICLQIINLSTKERDVYRYINPTGAMTNVIVIRYTQ